MHHSHVVSLQCSAQCAQRRTAQLTHLTHSANLDPTQLTRLHTAPSTPPLVACAPAGGPPPVIDPGPPGDPGPPPKSPPARGPPSRTQNPESRIQHPAPSTQLPARQRRILDPGSLKLPTKFMNRGGVASRFQFPSSSTRTATYCAALAWCRLLDCLPRATRVYRVRYP